MERNSVELNYAGRVVNQITFRNRFVLSTEPYGPTVVPWAYLRRPTSTHSPPTGTIGGAQEGSSPRRSPKRTSLVRDEHARAWSIAAGTEEGTKRCNFRVLSAVDAPGFESGTHKDGDDGAVAGSQNEKEMAAHGCKARCRASAKKTGR